jgi:hypothetical protein
MAPSKAPGGRETTPPKLADTTPNYSRAVGDTHFFETMMQVQKSIGELVAKTDRLIKDVEQQDRKLDRLRLWAAGVIGAGVLVGGAITYGLTAWKFFSHQ